ncbi:MAG: Peptide methionine sulfoxide reductase MsrA [Bacteroidota bacterium]|jgi:peptide-methionine (S)-S-oxide reductase
MYVKKFWIGFSLLVLILTGCAGKRTQKEYTKNNSNKQVNMNTDTAILAGGCFWCLDAVYRQMEGIVSIECGYANGKIKKPTYKEVCSGLTGHAEVTQLVFDTEKTNYAEILTVFWKIHDPTTLNRQGNDIGTQYRSGIYYRNDAQKDIALKSRDAAVESKLWEDPIVTEIVPLDCYYAAEEYHQDYYSNNPDQPYCVAVVGEKAAKFRKLFADKLKK